MKLSTQPSWEQECSHVTERYEALRDLAWEREREYTRKKQVQLVGNKRQGKEGRQKENRLSKKAGIQSTRRFRDTYSEIICAGIVFSLYRAWSYSNRAEENRNPWTDGTEHHWCSSPLKLRAFNLYVQRKHLNAVEILRSTWIMTKTQEIQLKFSLKQHQTSS